MPEHVREHIDLIKPTVHFNHRAGSEPARMRKRTTDKLGYPSSFNGPKTTGKKPNVKPSLDTCDQFITPDCLRALYNINYKPVSTQKNSYGIGESRFVSKVESSTDIIFLVEFTPQAFLTGDLDLFFTYVIVIPYNTFSDFAFSNFSTSQVGSRPILVSIDGGLLSFPFPL